MHAPRRADHITLTPRAHTVLLDLTLVVSWFLFLGLQHHLRAQCKQFVPQVRLCGGR